MIPFLLSLSFFFLLSFSLSLPPSLDCRSIWWLFLRGFFWLHTFRRRRKKDGRPTFTSVHFFLSIRVSPKGTHDNEKDLHIFAFLYHRDVFIMRSTSFQTLIVAWETNVDYWPCSSFLFSFSVCFLALFFFFLAFLACHQVDVPRSTRASKGTERFNLMGVVRAPCYIHRRDQFLTTDYYRMAFFTPSLGCFSTDSDVRRRHYDDGCRSCWVVLAQRFFSSLFLLSFSFASLGLIPHTHATGFLVFSLLVRPSFIIHKSNRRSQVS